MKQNIKIIISGGGTGGHIFPAISIANALKAKLPNAQFLFVGAEGRMEMEKVPAAGYEIIGLPVSGFDRSHPLKNIKVLFRLLKSMRKAKKIIKTFQPDIVIGVGGYASGPTLKAANKAGIKTVLQEQNSFAGVTNKLLAKKASLICVAYENMSRFFPKDKIILTGNPVRQNLKEGIDKKEEGYQYFNFDPSKKTLLIVGGSLGARTINQSIMAGIDKLAGSDIQVIWQTGKIYIDNIREEAKKHDTQNINITDFISRMDYAYSIADLIISRAGASSISELCLLEKATILVPSPNVSEDHQTHNAMALVNKDAAIMIRDNEAVEKLTDKALELIHDDEKLNNLRKNIAKLAEPDSANRIADEIIKLIDNKEIDLATHYPCGTPRPNLKSSLSPLEGDLGGCIYFLGIGGIGMSALARYFNAKGYQVAGYDRTRTPLTIELENEGIHIHYEENLSLIEDIYKQKENCLVVYTPAVPADNIEFMYFTENGFRVMKRAQLLGEVTRQSKGICIAGTHGKTTTSTMTAHLIYSSAVGCSAFLGGVSKNYAKNILFCDDSDYVVIEADEYDRSFHQLLPYMALITAVDADHLDIYNDKDSFLQSFEQFASLVQENGYLIVKHGIELNLSLNKNVTQYTYGIEQGDFHAANIHIENEEITFDFVTPTETVENITLGVPVFINIENGVGAMALAYLAGVKPDELKKAMASYAGIKRRFDIQVKNNDIVYLDDYAHHPEELKASIKSIRALYPNRHLCGIFQPHLYTRTRDFYNEFAQSLSMLDELILLDIYPAREKPIEGVTSDIIFNLVNIPNKIRATKNELIEILKNKELKGVLVTFGAGDIDTCVPEIKEMLAP